MVISISAILIATFNAVFGSSAFGYSALYAVLATVFGAFAEVSIDVIASFVIKLLPKKWFSHDKKFYSMSKGERKFFEKIGIRRWKDKVPDLGVLGGAVSKKKLTSFNDNVYISRFLFECAYGQVMHIAAAILGFLLVPLYPFEYWYCFGLPIAVVNCVLNCMSLFVLRYNFGRLKTLYMYNERKQNRAKGIKKP